MNASDIMSGTVQEVAELLQNNRISAVPVVDDSGELVGMASSGTPTRAPGMTARGG
jgi:CBS domain-containing protein